MESVPGAVATGPGAANLEHLGDGTRATLRVLTSFTLIERVTTFTIKVTKILGFNEIKSRVVHAAK
jgi:hypothetical protein